jgi:hypothetical protein
MLGCIISLNRDSIPSDGMASSGTGMESAIRHNLWVPEIPTPLW